MLAGKAPAGADDSLFAEWTARLLRRGVRVFMDADGELLIRGVQASPTLIKPNDAELSRLTGRSLADRAEMIAAARALNDQGIETVVISLGGDGALFVRRDAALYGQGLKVDVQSTVGAGDSMLAAMAFGFEKGLPFRDTCALAMAFSAAAVTTPGTQPADMALVRQLLNDVSLNEITIEKE